MSQPMPKKSISAISIVAIIIVGIIFIIIYLTERGCNSIAELAEKFKRAKLLLSFETMLPRLRESNVFR